MTRIKEMDKGSKICAGMALSVIGAAFALSGAGITYGVVGVLLAAAVALFVYSICFFTSNLNSGETAGYMLGAATLITACVGGAVGWGFPGVCYAGGIVFVVYAVGIFGSLE